MTWGPWTQWYDLDSPPAQHSRGATFSFADGHSDYWKWVSDFTVEIGSMSFEDYEVRYNRQAAAPGCEDLLMTQRSIWGKTGY